MTLLAAVLIYVATALAAIHYLRTQPWAHWHDDLSDCCPYGHNTGPCDCYFWVAAGWFWPITLALRIGHLSVVLLARGVIALVGDKPNA